MKLRAEVGMLPPRFTVSCAVGAGLLHTLWPVGDLLDAPAAWIGLAPMVAGVGLAVAAKRRFQVLDTTVNTFQDPRKLVTTGLYAWTRNPMYLGLALFLAGVAVLLGSVWGLIALGLFVVVTDRWYITFEERRMEATFGEAYRAYRVRTRRWI